MTGLPAATPVAGCRYGCASDFSYRAATRAELASLKYPTDGITLTELTSLCQDPTDVTPTELSLLQDPLV